MPSMATSRSLPLFRITLQTPFFAKLWQFLFGITPKKKLGLRTKNKRTQAALYVESLLVWTGLAATLDVSLPPLLLCALERIFFLLLLLLFWRGGGGRRRRMEKRARARKKKNSGEQREEEEWRARQRIWRACQVAHRNYVEDRVASTFADLGRD